MVRTYSRHNWLIRKVVDGYIEYAIERYANGKVLDIGCGEKPYKSILAPVTTDYLGLDLPWSLHSKDQIDVFATAYNIPIGDCQFDTVLMTSVLEHLEDPLGALEEARRVLRKGGSCIITVPFTWHLHEEPRDYYRYTKYGLQYLSSKAGFDVQEVLPISGFVLTFTQELCYFLQRFRRGLLGWPVAGVQFLLQRAAYVINRWDNSSEFTVAYLLIVKKQ